MTLIWGRVCTAGARPAAGSPYMMLGAPPERSAAKNRRARDAGGGQRVDVLKAEGRLGALSRRQLVGTLRTT